MAIASYVDFKFLFYFLFLGPKVLVLGSKGVRLGLLMVSNHLGKVNKA
jgi:hypothetical protein